MISVVFIGACAFTALPSLVAVVFMSCSDRAMNAMGYITRAQNTSEVHVVLGVGTCCKKMAGPVIVSGLSSVGA